MKNRFPASVMPKCVTLAPWEAKEWERHVEQMHNERLQKEFLILGIRRIAMRVNDRNPFLASELLDLIDDCTKQINREKQISAKV